MEVVDVEGQTQEPPCECRICYEAYKATSRSRAPKTLLCGHSLCLHCLRRLVCKGRLLSFVVCPYCRSATPVPESGIQALRTDEETLRRASVCTNGSEASESNSGRSSPSPSNHDLHLPLSAIFTVSESVPPEPGQLWGGSYMQEIRSTYLLGITRRVALSEAHPSPTPSSISTDCLRICFAFGLIVSIACVFFILIFFK
ncbi:hypothetical protein XENTR_v10019951 [Xenopus tropicalis]|uniref:RING-type domain-containing protein n=1 Tax=Xenopus tropicalis TaxID=8364 RepID=A0A1B8Y024_XENTR|nr:hypothetical protein XENTR_v10019951 [Xenopus tropicalis]